MLNLWNNNVKEDEYIFDNNLVYPLDNYGSYIELDGKIISIDTSNTYPGDSKITVKTDEGCFTGRWQHNIPKIGYYARIRVYDSFGYCLIDNRIVSWSSNK